MVKRLSDMEYNAWEFESYYLPSSIVVTKYGSKELWGTILSWKGSCQVRDLEVKLEDGRTVTKHFTAFISLDAYKVLLQRKLREIEKWRNGEIKKLEKLEKSREKKTEGNS